MNENRAEIKAKIVETEMKKYFGSLVSNFNLIDAFYGNGHEEFSLGFKYCDYFDMRFNYGQGACGCCICYDWGDNNEAIYNVPLVKTQMKKIIVTAKTLYSHPKNVSKIYAALHTDLAW